MDHWTEIYSLLSAVLQTVSFVEPTEEWTDERPQGLPGEA
jgi:hypothetical protein